MLASDVPKTVITHTSRSRSDVSIDAKKFCESAITRAKHPGVVAGDRERSQIGTDPDSVGTRIADPTCTKSLQRGRYF